MMIMMVVENFMKFIPIGIISGSATTRDGMWRHTRRFTMRHLRDFGFGIRRSMQIFANREMTDLAHTLDGYINDEDGIIDPSILFNIPSANLAWASIAGYRFEPDDVRSAKLVDLMAQYTNIADFSSGPANMYPFLMNWYPFLFKMNQIYRIDDEIHKFLKVDNYFLHPLLFFKLSYKLGCIGFDSNLLGITVTGDTR